MALLASLKANIALNKLKQFELVDIFCCETTIIEMAFECIFFCLQEFQSSPPFSVSR